MRSSTRLPLGFLVVALGLGGAMIATAQSAPLPADTAAADTPAANVPAAAVVAAGYHGDRDGHARAEGPRGQRDAHRSARQGPRGPGGPQGPRGGMVRGLFDAADADGDGALTAAEIDAYRTARIGAVDASGDGALSIEEFETLYSAVTRPRMVDAFQRLDADGDGRIAPEELDSRIAQVVARLDRDGDGILTLQGPGRGPGGGNGRTTTDQ